MFLTPLVLVLMKIFYTLLLLAFVRSFSYTPHASSCEKSVGFLVRNFSYTPGASSSSVRSFPYTPDASFSEEFHFHSSCLVVLVS